MDKCELFWIAGQLHAKLPLLASATREAVDLALVDAAWKAFVRDAGPGETGPMFAGWQNGEHVLLTSDPRAGAVLAWLSSRDGPLRKAAERLHAARGSSGRRFTADEKGMLSDARETLEREALRFDREPPVDHFSEAILSFRNDWRFASGPPGYGEDVGGAWAINLALATLKAPAPMVGILTRQSLRHDLQFDAVVMKDCWTQQLWTLCGRVSEVVGRCAMIAPVLETMSKNARARDVAAALAAMNSLRRTDVRRGWQLSDARTTLVMRQLVDAGIAESIGRGMMGWSSDTDREPSYYDEWMRRQDALIEFEQAMENADRVLQKSAQSAKISDGKGT